MIAGLLVGAIFLYLTVRQIDIQSCWVYIKQADKLWILAAIVAYFTAFIIRSFRWKTLIAPLKADAPANRLFSFLVIGFFMNNVLPLRLGEFVRANVTGQKFAITRSGVLATVVVERLFDGVSYLVLFLLTVLVLPFPQWAKNSFAAGAVVFIGILAFMFFLVKHREVAEKIIHKIPFPEKIRQRARGIFINFIDGLKVFSNGGALVKVFLLSICVWSAEASVFFMMAKAFSLNLTYFHCIFVMIIIGMGAILPTAPGYVGTVEFLGVTALGILSIDKNMAFGYIVTLHVAQLATIAALGIRSLVVEKISFSELVRIEKQA